MGLDLALGGIVLVAALRGWLKGFVGQAVRIGGFIACFYLADPVREQVRPYVIGKLPAIDAGLLDRLLWWVAAVISYIVLVGLANLAIQLTRSPLACQGAGDWDGREDQFGGMLVGIAKGLLVATFLAAAVEKYGADIGQKIPWAGRQTTGSYALKWTAEYRPAPRIWAAPPVRSFVQHIQRNGLRSSDEGDAEKQLARQNLIDAEVATGLPRLEMTPCRSRRARRRKPGSEPRSRTGQGARGVQGRARGPAQPLTARRHGLTGVDRISAPRHTSVHAECGNPSA